MTEENVIETGFTSIDLPRREWPEFAISRYRVWRDRSNYVIVEAETAIDALKVSAMHAAFLIEKEIVLRKRVLPAQAETAIAAVPAAAPDPLPEKISLPPIADSALSADDVTRLLAG